VQQVFQPVEMVLRAESVWLVAKLTFNCSRGRDEGSGHESLALAAQEAGTTSNSCFSPVEISPLPAGAD
jgi:hypothetical protein